MSYFLPPVGSLDYQRASNNVQSAQTGVEETAARQLSSLFIKTFIKEVIKDQSGDGLFGDNPSGIDRSEIMANKLADQLAESDAFGLNKLIGSSMEKEKAAEIIRTIGNTSY